MTAMDAPSSSAYIRYAVTVLFALACVVTGVELVLRASVIPEDFDAYLVERTYKSKVTNVLLGDSHFRNAFRVESSGFVNLSAGGTNARMMQISAHEYFRHRTPGKVVVLASAQLFSGPRIRDNVHGMDDFFGQNKLGLPFQLYFFEPGVARLLSRGVHYFDLKDLRRLQYAGEPVPPDDPLVANDSWTGRKEAYRVKTTIGRAEWQRPQENFESTPDYAAYRETVSFLKERGGEVCMLRTPITQGYLVVIANDERYLAAENALRRIASEIGVRFVDFRTLPMAFPDSVFRDQDHLNRTGSRQFVPLVMQHCFGDRAGDRPGD